MNGPHGHPHHRRLLLLRHAETTAGKGVLLGSRSDSGLSERGREQALIAGSLLRKRRLAAVVASPQRRALETVEIALPRARVRIDDRLRELDFGVFTGLTWRQVKAQHALAHAAWQQDRRPPPAGEDPRRMCRRVIVAVLEVLAEVASDPRGDVVVITHNHPIGAILSTAAGHHFPDAGQLRVRHGEVLAVRCSPAVMRRWRSVVEGRSRESAVSCTTRSYPTLGDL